MSSFARALKETHLGVAQAFLTPKKDHVKTQIWSSLGIDVIENIDYMNCVNEARKLKR